MEEQDQYNSVTPPPHHSQAIACQSNARGGPSIEDFWRCIQATCSSGSLAQPLRCHTLKSALFCKSRAGHGPQAATHRLEFADAERLCSPDGGGSSPGSARSTASRWRSESLIETRHQRPRLGSSLAKVSLSKASLSTAFLSLRRGTTLVRRASFSKLRLERFAVRTRMRYRTGPG